MIAALPALAASHAVLSPSPLRPLAPQQITMALDQKANAMFDTVDATDKRPDFITSLETRDKLTAAFLAHGVVVAREHRLLARMGSDPLEDRHK